MLAAPSEAPWLFGRMGDTYTTALLLVHGGTLGPRDTRETRSHMQPGKQPRGTERQRLTMQGAHLPPTPIWTRAPRQHLVLLVRILRYRPSLHHLYASLLRSISSYLRFHFVRTLTREIMEIMIILSSLIFCLSSVLQKTKNCCDLLRVSSPISSYSFALRWNLNQEKKLFVSMILSSLIFSLLRKDKNCCDYSCLLFNQAIETVVILTVI